MKNEFGRSECPARRWMVVDDNEEVLRAMALALETISDIEIVCFDSGAKALEAFSTSPSTFDLVVTDFDMPDMNGIELCRRLRSMSPKLKVVLATGSGLFTEAEALYNGFRTVLPKPFSITSLERALRTAGVLDFTEACAI